MSCSIHEQTVVSKPIVSHQASADGNQFNSGIVSVEAGGFRVTQHFVNRYSAMLATYGGRFTPPMKSDDSRGILVTGNGIYIMDAEAMGRMDKMVRWKRAEAGP